MTANPNTMDFKQTWDTIYQITHYKVPGYKAIADESIVPKLQEGQQFHRTYASDIVADNMGGDGGYNNTPITDTDEYITVNKVKYASFYLKKLDEIQAHLPVRIKYAQKSMNELFRQIDADVLSSAYQNAGSVVDASAVGGNAGTSISMTTGNIQQIFGAAEQNLRLQNVIYDPAASFSGQFKLDRAKAMPVSLVSAQLYNVMLLYLGGKTSVLGDEVSRNGFVGKFFGFNTFVDNNLPWSGQLDLSVNPTDGDTFTLLNGISVKTGTGTTSQAVTFTFKNTPAAAGDLKIASTAALTVTNLVAALNDPFTTIANATNTGFVAFTRINSGGTITSGQNRLLNGITATQVTSAGVASASGTSAAIIIAGMGNVPVTQVMTSSSNAWLSTSLTQHNIFGVNNSISVVIQRTPMFEILQANPQVNSGNNGRVGKDFVTWVPYGIQVFTDQIPMLVDVQINTASAPFTVAPTPVIL